MSTYETVLQATRDLHHSGVVVTRETLESTTGMKLTTIDENVKRGIECGDIVRIHRGVYMPNAQMLSRAQYPARAWPMVRY